jgi:hypothetical protein
MSVDDHRHKIFESRSRRRGEKNTQINNMISDINVIQTLREYLKEAETKNQSQGIPKL